MKRKKSLIKGITEERTADFHTSAQPMMIHKEPALPQNQVFHLVELMKW